MLVLLRLRLHVARVGVVVAGVHAARVHRVLLVLARHHAGPRRRCSGGRGGRRAGLLALLLLEERGASVM